MSEEAAVGGGTRHTESKTRTPHKVVGKNKVINKYMKHSKYWRKSIILDSRTGKTLYLCLYIYSYIYILLTGVQPCTCSGSLLAQACVLHVFLLLACALPQERK